MTVAEQTLESWVDDGSDFAFAVMACRNARARGLDFVAFVTDLNADPGYNPGPMMDWLMSLGFSRSWTVSDDGKEGKIEVRWL